MTGEQKQRIQNMRLQGIGYTQIADSLGLSANTVKSFCRRNNLTACNASNDTMNNDNKEICKQCGKRLKQKPKSKPKTFCSDKCRYDWWNINRDKKSRKSVKNLTCAHCGCTFKSYDKNRKYCGHACYISDRFREEARHDERAV